MRSAVVVFLSLSALGVTSPALGQRKVAAKVTTYTYKKVGDLEIKLDVHRLNDSLKRPVAVWIHGGALIMGHRAAINSRVKKMLLEYGYILVSIDYRLAPETKLPDIISDVEDAFAWIRKEGPKRFNADVSKIAVLGGSAGGYLTLVAGYRVQPRPTVLVSFWGYGDLIGEWISTPSRHPRHRRSRVSREQAFKQVSGEPIADARDREGNGGVFYQYCRRAGIWPKQISGWDPAREARKYLPYMPVKNVSIRYPPTMLIHGTRDTDVPYEQSLLMATQFRKNRVPYELITVVGGEHGLVDANPKRVDAAYRDALRFVNKHMGYDQAPKSKVAK